MPDSLIPGMDMLFILFPMFEKLRIPVTIAAITRAPITVLKKTMILESL